MSTSEHTVMTTVSALALVVIAFTPTPVLAWYSNPYQPKPVSEIQNSQRQHQNQQQSQSAIAKGGKGGDANANAMANGGAGGIGGAGGTGGNATVTVQGGGAAVPSGSTGGDFGNVVAPPALGGVASGPCVGPTYGGSGGGSVIGLGFQASTEDHQCTLRENMRLLLLTGDPHLQAVAIQMAKQLDGYREAEKELSTQKTALAPPTGLHGSATTEKKTAAFTPEFGVATVYSPTVAPEDTRDTRQRNDLGPNAGTSTLTEYEASFHR